MDYFDKIKDRLSSKLKGKELMKESSFKELGIDSLDLVDLVFELEEEIGYTADLELLYDFYSAIGFCNERIKLYVATNLKPVENPRPLDDDEFLELYELTYEECMELVASGAIQDAKTIIALQYYALHFGGK